MKKQFTFLPFYLFEFFFSLMQYKYFCIKNAILIISKVVFILVSNVSKEVTFIEKYFHTETEKLTD